MKDGYIKCAGCGIDITVANPRENAKRIIEAREYTVCELEKLGFEILPSKANFVFAKADFIGGEELYKALKQKVQRRF